MCADHLEDLFIQCQETSSFTVPSQDHCHHDSLFRSVSCVKFVLKRELSRSNSPFRSWARGLGIATLTMHHGTVLGTGFLFAFPKTVPWCIVNLAFTRFLAQLWNGPLLLMGILWRKICPI